MQVKLFEERKSLNQGFDSSSPPNISRVYSLRSRVQREWIEHQPYSQEASQVRKLHARRGDERTQLSAWTRPRLIHSAAHSAPSRRQTLA